MSGDKLGARPTPDWLRNIEATVAAFPPIVIFILDMIAGCVAFTVLYYASSYLGELHDREASRAVASPLKMTILHVAEWFFFIMDIVMFLTFSIIRATTHLVTYVVSGRRAMRAALREE